MAIKKILVLFKTHLDIGFTDLSANVVKCYMDSFIPSAVRVAKELRNSEGDARLVWTTGSWLIHEYLRTHPGAEGQDVLEGIQNGDVRWHGLPFTTHTELMTPDILQYGLSLSQELDARFGKQTIAAKMTDVPGHTKAIIPYLKQAGIEFLHIGVNPACSVPEVPELFRWKAESGEMINVMYHHRYGSFSEIGNTGTAIYFAHTGDNMGVQSAEEIQAIFDELKAKAPGAQIVAADLNDVALAVREIADTLPILTDEIGDTWIHGLGTDPRKVFHFRALARLFHTLPDGADKTALGQGMIMVPEHTWGCDVKKKLNDYVHFMRSDFQQMRKTAPNFQLIEESWAEQRAYLTDAVSNLSDETKAIAEQMMAEYRRDPAPQTGTPVVTGQILSLGDWRLRFNAQGEIDLLEKGEVKVADEAHRLVTLQYEQFSAGNYDRFYCEYGRPDLDDGTHYWARRDFKKVGMENGVDRYTNHTPTATVYAETDRIVVQYVFDEKAHGRYGCPAVMDLILTVREDALFFDLAWFDKPANRVAEAIWAGFHPIATGKRIGKLGQTVDPSKVVSKGQRQLHGTDFGVVYNELSIESMDAALVAPQAPSLLSFPNVLPREEDGIHFNLYNNAWGTNFPMWYDEDARFRFVLRLN